MKQDDVCCNGNCSQGDTCPRYRSQPSDASWLASDALVYAIGLVCLALVLSGYLDRWVQ